MAESEKITYGSTIIASRNAFDSPATLPMVADDTPAYKFTPKALPDPTREDNGTSGK